MYSVSSPSPPLPLSLPLPSPSLSPSPPSIWSSGPSTGLGAALLAALFLPRAVQPSACVPALHCICFSHQPPQLRPFWVLVVLSLILTADPRMPGSGGGHVHQVCQPVGTGWCRTRHCGLSPSLGRPPEPALLRPRGCGVPRPVAANAGSSRCPRTAPLGNQWRNRLFKHWPGLQSCPPVGVSGTLFPPFAGLLPLHALR